MFFLTLITFCPIIITFFFFLTAGVLLQVSNIVITDTEIVSEHSVAVDKLSANWQSRTGSIQMTYYVTTIFPVRFLSNVLISPLHPCLNNSSNRTGVLLEQ